MKKKLSELKDKIKKKKKDFKLRRTEAPLKMAFFDSIHFVDKAVWNDLTEDQNCYLTYEYLSVLEDIMSSDEHMNFRYVIFYFGKRPAAVGYFQLVDISGESVGLDPDLRKTTKLQGNLLGKLGMRVMVNGNLFCSGPNGFHFDPEVVNQDDAYQSLAIAMYRIRRAEKLQGQITVILTKDFFEADYEGADNLMSYGYRSFSIDPNMILHLEAEWTGMEDYLAAMTSKYRSQYKKVMKRSAGIESRFLTTQEIKKYASDIQELFDAVHDKASYKFGRLNAMSFAGWKKEMPDSFYLKGYFLEEKMVGFFSAFVNGDAMDSNYVGMDYTHNAELGIYQTMLYDYVELALEKRLSKIHYGRTAGEMKSSLGAVPVEMKCYMRHQNTLSNKLLKPLVQFITPSEFSQREPFKKKN